MNDHPTIIAIVAAQDAVEMIGVCDDYWRKGYQFCGLLPQQPLERLGALPPHLFHAVFQRPVPPRAPNHVGGPR